MLIDSILPSSCIQDLSKELSTHLAILLLVIIFAVVVRQEVPYTSRLCFCHCTIVTPVRTCIFYVTIVFYLCSSSSTEHRNPLLCTPATLVLTLCAFYLIGELRNFMHRQVMSRFLRCAIAAVGTSNKVRNKHRPVSCVLSIYHRHYLQNWQSLLNKTRNYDARG